jgi:hypothetical protein
MGTINEQKICELWSSLLVIMSDNHLPTIAKLDSIDYMVWITRMEDHLVGRDLMEAVTPGFLSGIPSVESLRKKTQGGCPPKDICE